MADRGIDAFRGIFGRELKRVKYRGHPSNRVLQQYLRGELKDEKRFSETIMKGLITGELEKWMFPEVAAHVMTCGRCSRRVAWLKRWEAVRLGVSTTAWKARGLVSAAFSKERRVAVAMTVLLIISLGLVSSLYVETARLDKRVEGLRKGLDLAAGEWQSAFHEFMKTIKGEGPSPQPPPGEEISQAEVDDFLARIETIDGEFAKGVLLVQFLFKKGGISLGIFNWYDYSQYVVKEGDTLGGIAEAVYGDRKLWPVLYILNHDLIEDVDKLPQGIVLTYPKRAG